ncbi:hypothetical protein Tco_0385031 [Tanacetum coccineum]
MVINSPCLTDKKELAIPGQTTTGKEFSNPLMAGSLPKTISAKGMDTGGSLRLQETIGGAPAQTSGEGKMEHTFELMDIVPPTPHDSPLLGGYTPRSDEEILKLKKRVKKLERQRKSSISHPRRRIYMQVESFDDDLDEEDSSKQGRTIDKTKLMFKDSDFDDLDDLVGEGMAFVQEKYAENQGKIGVDDTEAVNTAGERVSTAAPRNPPTTTTVFDDEDVTMAMAQTLIKMKEEKAKEKGVAIKDVEYFSRPIRSITTLQPLPTIDPKDKGKGILQETEPVEKTNKKVQGDAHIERDAEIALRLQTKLDEELRVERERQEEASKIAIAEMFDEVQARIDANYELSARMTHEEQEKYTIEERARLLAKNFERRKKQLAAERAEAIRNKPPTKTQLRNLMMTYLKNMGGSYATQKSSKKPKVMKYAKDVTEEEAAEYEKEKEELRLNLRMIFDLDEKGELWMNQLDWKLLRWKLYEKCGVHTLFMDGTPMEINMIVEKKYPLVKELLEKILNLQLEAEEESTMAFELIKFIKSLLEERTSAPTEPSSHDESSSLYAELGLTESDTESDEEVPPVVKMSQTLSTPGVHAGPNLEHTDAETADATSQPQPGQMDEDSTGTLSSLQHLAKDFSFGDQFFNDKPLEANNEKATADTEAESMVSVTIHQDTSAIPPITSPVIDLVSVPNSPTVHRPLPTTTTATATTTTTIMTTIPLPPQPQQVSSDSILINRLGELEQHIADLVDANQALEERLDKHRSRLYRLENQDVPNQVSKAVDEIVTDAVDWAMHAPLSERFRDLPEADMKEILHNRIKKKKKRQGSPKTPLGSPPHPPPPPPPPAGPSGTSGASGASGSSQSQPPPPPPSNN